MTRFLKNLFFQIMPACRLPRDRASILMYHAVGGQNGYFSAIRPQEFSRHLAYLAARHYPVVPLAEIVRRVKERKPLGGAVALTFDDGYRDNYTVAFPLLKQYGFPATVFVTTGLIGKTDKRGLDHCSENELRTMHESGLIAIEPHSVTHPNLAGLPEAEARREIEGSREAIGAIRGTEPDLFAYPYGALAEETVSLLRSMGFAGAVSVDEGTVSAGADPYRLPRNSVDSSTTFAQFRGKVSRSVDWYRAMKGDISAP